MSKLRFLLVIALLFLSSTGFSGPFEEKVMAKASELAREYAKVGAEELAQDIFRRTSSYKNPAPEVDVNALAVQIAMHKYSQLVFIRTIPGGQFLDALNASNYVHFFNDLKFLVLTTADGKQGTEDLRVFGTSFPAAWSLGRLGRLGSNGDGILQFRKFLVMSGFMADFMGAPQLKFSIDHLVAGSRNDRPFPSSNIAKSYIKKHLLLLQSQEPGLLKLSDEERQGIERLSKAYNIDSNKFLPSSKEKTIVVSASQENQVNGLLAFCNRGLRFLGLK